MKFYFSLKYKLFDWFTLKWYSWKIYVQYALNIDDCTGCKWILWNVSLATLKCKCHHQLWNHFQSQPAAISVRNFLIQEDILIVTIGGLGLLALLLLFLLLKTKRRAALIQVTLVPLTLLPPSVEFRTLNPSGVGFRYSRWLPFSGVDGL